MIWALSLLRTRMVRVGIPGQFHCWLGCARMSLHGACGVLWNPCTIGSRRWLVRGRVVRGCAAWSVWIHSERPPLGPALTRTRDWSASAKYWIDLIILLAPSLHLTPCCKVPAASMTDFCLAAITTLRASRRRKDIMRSGLCPPVGFASGVT